MSAIIEDPESQGCRRGCAPSAETPGKRRSGGWLFPLAGVLSLIWFLARVLPKPSRAAYPCQRVAAPLASSFVLWILGLLASVSAFRRAGAPALADSLERNAPIGTPKGISPGRVVWVHDPEATNWEGPGNGHWWENDHTNQSAVDRMMSDAVRRIGNRDSDPEAWDAIFHHFNSSHGNGDTGYESGEKIAIKINLVGCIIGRSGGVDPQSYDLTRNVDYMNASPQVMLALLRQLVNAAGVRQADISIGDPLGLFPNQYYDMLHGEFPDVRYMDHDGGKTGLERRRVQPSAVPFYWSCRPSGATQDYVPDAYAEAKYFINMANLKSHTLAGVTLCAKNHFGSLMRTPVEGGYYNMHTSLTRNVPQYGQYRALVDLMGHANTGGKALIYLIDGLYSGVHPTGTAPKKWESAPFNGDWSSSIFMSQDPVAIDSVAFDFLWTEWKDFPHMPGTDDYLHEAALADNPPSGTFYDPDHATATVRLASLGVHEHWNNPENRQYTRNLGTGEGIELVAVTP